EASVVIIEPSNAKVWQASGKAKRRREKKKAEEAAKLQNTQQTDGTTSSTANNQPDNAGQKDLKEKKEEKKSTKPQDTQQTENTVSPPADAKPGDNGKKKVKRKKRKTGFGHSIKNRCPGKQQQKIKQVFESTRGEYHTVDKNFRASQYDHELDEYIKKELSQRIHILGKSKIKVQRDVYSAFLEFCSSEDFKTPDKKLCDKLFEKFYALYKEEIERMINDRRKVCNSGIRVA
uniref:hypothetical protein n=1 Tax=uncultured Mailhella sp. TaxID=1981031 RepID=UPI00261AC355